MMEKGKRLFGKKLSTEQAFWLCLVNGASPVAAALLSDRLCGFLKPGTERLSAILVVGILLGSLVLPDPGSAGPPEKTGTGLVRPEEGGTAGCGVCGFGDWTDFFRNYASPSAADVQRI